MGHESPLPLRIFHGLIPGVLACLAAAWPAAAQGGLASAITAYAGDSRTLPPRLSGTGLYASLAPPLRVSAGIVPFEVNAPLWSDGSHKERFVAVPPGRPIVPTDSDGYAFPDGTVLVKNFHLDTVLGDAASRILVETRFLIARGNPPQTRWHGISYAWHRDQSDADLVDALEGRDEVVAVRTAPGTRKGKRWRYPSASDCRQCHSGRGSLGFITPQLNRPARGDAAVNQLRRLADLGVLAPHHVTATPPAWRWHGLDEAGAPLEKRARSYLAANCSHCHGNGSATGPIHSFDYFSERIPLRYDPASPFVYGPYVGAPSSGGPAVPQMAYPGFPDSSFLVKRMLSRGTFEDVNPAQMPPLATYQPDSAAVKVVADWICSLGGKPAGSCPLPATPGGDFWASRIRHALAGGRAGLDLRVRREDAGMVLSLPGEGAGGTGEPVLADLQGRRVALRRLGPAAWRVPGRLPAGLYTLTLRGRSRQLALVD